VRVFSTEVTIAEKQMSSSRALVEATTRLASLKKEKEDIEKRLALLPELIAEAERAEKERQMGRLLHETKWIGQPGDEVMVNLSNKEWKKCKLVEVDGALLVEEIKFFFFTPQSPVYKPLPGPAFYHSAAVMITEEDRAMYVDQLLPELLVDSLGQHLDNLLHEKSLDLHPGSDGHVVNLIHPSLFPFIKGLTKVVDESVFAECAAIEGDYCWLPAEFFVDGSGTVSIESYINNLDQDSQPALYLDIAQTFQAMLPMFERTLSRTLRSCTLQVIVKAAYYFIPPGEQYSGLVDP
jgi:hypothetical protein